MLHRIYQKHNILPQDFYLMDDRHKTFIYASELIVMDEELEEQKRMEKASKKGGNR